MENLLFDLGNEAFDKGEYEEAKVQYKKALEIEPKSLGIMYNLSLALFECSDFTESKELSDKIINTKDVSFYVLTLFNRGNCNQYLNLFNAAIADFSRIIELYPDDPNAYYNRANAYEKIKNAKAAKSDRRIANMLEKENFTDNLYKPVEVKEIDDYNLDKFTYDKEKLEYEIKQNPDSYSHYFELGNVYAKIREFQKAIGCFQKAIELYPDEYYENANQNLIAAYYDHKNYAKAVELADEFIKYNSEVMIVYVLRKWALEELN